MGIKDPEEERVGVGVRDSLTITVLLEEACCGVGDEAGGRRRRGDAHSCVVASPRAAPRANRQSCALAKAARSAGDGRREALASSRPITGTACSFG